MSEGRYASQHSLYSIYVSVKYSLNEVIESAADVITGLHTGHRRSPRAPPHTAQGSEAQPPAAQARRPPRPPSLSINRNFMDTSVS